MDRNTSRDTGKPSAEENVTISSTTHPSLRLRCDGRCVFDSYLLKAYSRVFQLNIADYDMMRGFTSVPPPAPRMSAFLEAKRRARGSLLGLAGATAASSSSSTGSGSAGHIPTSRRAATLLVDRKSGTGANCRQQLCIHMTALPLHAACCSTRLASA